MRSMDVLAADEAVARRRFWWFMLVALAVLAAGIGLRDPWPPDEPRFALVARQMLESGQWLFPHRGIELYSDKPPMLMWCEAVLMWLSGGWRGAFLLPSLMAGLGTLALLYHLGRRLWDARVGLAAAVVLLSAMQFVEVIKHAQIDPLVLFWITLGNTGILLHCLRGPDWRMYWLGCFAAGIGVITKGVGVIALLMLIPYAYARLKRWPGVLQTQGDGWRWAGGALAFVLAIALWLVPMLSAAYGLRTPEYLAYVHDLLFRQTAERYAHSWAHAEPFWFFALVIVRDWFPVCLLIPAMLPRWRQALAQREVRVWLPLAWWLLALLFFSIPRGKREIYILPGLPMLALAMAPYLTELLRTRWLQRLALGLSVLAAAACLGAGGWALLAQPKLAVRIAQGYQLADGGRMLWFAVIGLGVLFALAAAIAGRRRAVAGWLAGMAAAWVAWSLITYPLLNDNQSTIALMRQADARIGPQGQLGLVLWREELLLQARRPVAEFGFARSHELQLRDALAWQAQAPEQRWILLNAVALNDCIDPRGLVALGSTNRVNWTMFPATAVRAHCVPTAGTAPVDSD
jgi:4-amino-4-deoxy-L-arabinose transferase-like glycosyltransferase